jgi:hypothetical protein
MLLWRQLLLFKRLSSRVLLLTTRGLCKGCVCCGAACMLRQPTSVVKSAKIVGFSCVYLQVVKALLPAHLAVCVSTVHTMVA